MKPAARCWCQEPGGAESAYFYLHMNKQTAATVVVRLKMKTRGRL
jgi:hypothetical protein